MENEMEARIILETLNHNGKHKNHNTTDKMNHTNCFNNAGKACSFVLIVRVVKRKP